MKRIAGMFVVTAVVAVAGAVAWSELAEPAKWTVFNGQLQMDQVAVAADFGVALAFAVVGLVGGLVLGVVVGALAPRVAWPLVPLAIALAVIATLVSWRLGIVLGPPDPSTVTGLDEGDTVPDLLAVDLPAAFLAWPIAAVAGMLPGVWVNRRDDGDASAGDVADRGTGERDQVGT